MKMTKGEKEFLGEKKNRKAGSEFLKEEEPNMGNLKKRTGETKPGTGTQLKRSIKKKGGDT